MNLDTDYSKLPTRAELEARRQVADSIHFFNRRLPGFERAYILSTSPEIGVRETRRIQGRYVLTQKDVVEGTKFLDVIARNNAPIDIHSPNDDRQTWYAAKTYQIPYRALVPKSLEQLLVAGRCISATHEAIGSVRFEPCCMNTGQASGAAAALAVKTDRSPATVDIVALQTILRAEGLVE